MELDTKKIIIILSGVIFLVSLGRLYAKNMELAEDSIFPGLVIACLTILIGSLISVYLAFIGVIFYVYLQVFLLERNFKHTLEYCGRTANSFSSNVTLMYLKKTNSPKSFPKLRGFILNIYSTSKFSVFFITFIFLRRREQTEDRTH